MLRLGPARFRDLAGRLPFSRFHAWVPALFTGVEEIAWKENRMRVNPGEIHGYYPYFFGLYSDDEIAFLRRVCGPAKLFADVGANIGLLSLAVARACPWLSVDSFEADPAVARRFEENLSLNPDLASRVRLINKAVSEKTGEISFASSDDAMNAGVGRISSGGRLLPCVALDEFYAGAKAPDVMKIDVEGAELDVLRGMKRIFAETPPKAMLIEVHGFYFKKESHAFMSSVEAFLLGAGYSLETLEGAPAGSSSSWPDRVHIVARMP
jgi:FkbM family methyltransferase